MNLDQYKKYSELLYSDKFTIQRYIDIENRDGSTGEGLDPNPVLIDIPCRISKVKLDEHNINIEDSNNKNIKLKIFCSPDVNVKKGDYIIAKRIINGNEVQTIKAIASEPFIYNINQEFILLESGEA